jgi:hypothetical protein
VGVSIRYEAKRTYKLTDNEKIGIKIIVEEYENKFKDDFDIYKGNPENAEIIFIGRTQLLSSIDLVVTYKTCLFLIKCLSDIRNIVKDAEWSVNINDTYELEWDEKVGWKLLKE